MSGLLMLGVIAALLTALCQLPQMFKVIKTKDTSSLSMTTYGVLCAGLTLWLVYGIIIKDIPLILSNVIGLLTTGIILVYKILYK